MWNAGLDELQAGIKIAGRNINNLKYAGDTTLMAESEEELKSLFESERGEWVTFKKLRSWNLVSSLHGKREGEKVETVADFIFLGFKVTMDGDRI